MKFNELPLHEQVLEGTEAAHFEECMPVQEKVLPVSIDGYDVMVQSKTGSGKTAVYIITFLEHYLRMKEEGASASCLIVAPTRELAQQISDDALVLCSKVKGFHVGCFYGGVGYEHQKKLLEMGCDIYVGTPGRLLEFMENRELDCSRIDTFVIDEADRMFDMGFYPDIKRMFRLLPPKENRQTMLFSATLEMRVRELAWEFMNDPEELELEPDHITVENITQELYHVAKSDKFGLFLQLLAVEKPEAALVFTNSRHMAGEIAARLKLNGYNADYLTGDLPQAQRQKALNLLKEGKTTILVATDVAARGLQIDDLPLVVNYDVPEDYENYVHRIGRTARAGKSGKAITFADEEFVYYLEPIEKYIKMKIPVIWPENLPEVEDKSIGKKWYVEGSHSEHSSSDGRKSSAKGSAKGSAMSSKAKANASKPKSSKPDTDKQNNSKPEYSKPKANNLKTTNPKSTKPNKSLGSMTEEERIAYYKAKYGFVPTAAAQAKAKADDNAQAEAKAFEKITSQATETAKPENKFVKFFKKLFGRNK